MGARRAEEGAVEDARRLLTQALRYDPTLASALLALAQLEFSQGNAARARACTDQLIALCPDDAYAQAMLGNIALNEQHPEQALQAYTRASALGGDTPELIYNTGLAHLALGQGEAATQIFLAMLAEQPLNPRAWDALGCARSFLHDHSGAVEAFLQALQLDPEQNDSRDHLAQLLLETGNTQRAREVLEAALVQEPHRPGSLHLLGMAFIKLQDYPQAIACWEELLSHGHSATETYHLLADAYMRLGDATHARQILEALVTHFPDYAPGHIQLALLLLHDGQFEVGRHHLERARLLDPQNPSLQRAQHTAATLTAQQTTPLAQDDD
jgi:tetratricopeptide (TPR) repeat protein